MSSSELAAAVCAVMQEVGHVQKTGRNDFGRYNYASDADLLRSLQPAMARNGLMLHPHRVERQDSTRTNARGKEEDRCDLLVTYHLRHVSGEMVEIQAPGTGMDSLDKAPYKAMTGAYKYALRQLFAVPTGDDPERDRKAPTKVEGIAKTKEWRQMQAALAEANVKYDTFRDAFEQRYQRRPDTLEPARIAKMCGNLGAVLKELGLT